MSILNEKNIEYEEVDEIRGRAVLKHDAVTKNKTIYSVQWTKRVGIDDTSTTVYQFDHKPTKNDINKADKIRNLRMKFSEFGDLPVEYDCEFDIHDDKLNQIEMRAENNYCGCA